MAQVLLGNTSHLKQTNEERAKYSTTERRWRCHHDNISKKHPRERIFKRFVTAAIKHHWSVRREEPANCCWWVCCPLVGPTAICDSQSKPIPLRAIGQEESQFIHRKILWLWSEVNKLTCWCAKHTVNKPCFNENLGVVSISSFSMEWYWI